MTRVACLHASLSNSVLFEEAAAGIGLKPEAFSHHARPDLLDAAVRAGELTEAIAAEAAAVLLELSQGADAVLLTCSTLGPAVRLAAGETSVPVIQADAALAAEAARARGNLVVLCTIEATLEPTGRLFAEAAAGTQASVQARLVSGAWPLFMGGDPDGYARAIAEAAEDEYQAGADLVVLAQASMAPAARLVTGGPEPLTVPRAAVAAVLAAVR